MALMRQTKKCFAKVATLDSAQARIRAAQALAPDAGAITLPLAHSAGDANVIVTRRAPTTQSTQILKPRAKSNTSATSVPLQAVGLARRQKNLPTTRGKRWRSLVRPPMKPCSTSLGEHENKRVYCTGPSPSLGIWRP